MPGNNPVTELTKVPGPVPSVVFELAVVGFWVVFQHTPRTVTAEPPSVVIVPPIVTELEVSDEATAVVRRGTVAGVVADNSFP